MALIDNIVAYYKLDESSGNAEDSVASYDLTNNNTVGYSSGKINNAGDTGSSNSNKTLSISDNLGITNGAITISMWVKLNAEISSGKYGFISKGDAGTDVHYYIVYDYNSGTPRLCFIRQRQEVANDQFLYNVTLGTANWYHLVLTYDGTNVEGYVNGDSKGTQASTGNGTGLGVDECILFLTNTYTAGSYASCLIDEVGIWSRALTSDEVGELYNSGSGFDPFQADCTVSPSALTLSTDDGEPTIYIFVLPLKMGAGLTLAVSNQKVSYPSTGGRGTRHINTGYPYVSGLIAEITKQTGRKENLVPQTSYIPTRMKLGM